MRFSSLLMSGWLVLVPILGLNSCSKKSDTWDLGEPTIESAGHSPVYLKSADLIGLPGDSALVLTSDDDLDVRADAACRFGDRSVRSRVDLSRVTRIPIRDLWPEEFWQTLDSETLKQTSCDFHFTASDKAGSTHDFEMLAVTMASFIDVPDALTVASADLSLSLTATSLTRLPAVSAMTVRSNTSVQDARLALICENLKTETKIGENSSAIVIDRLLKQDIKTISGVDPRDEKTVQNCRLLKTESLPGGLPHYSLVPSFQFKFPPPALDVKFHLDLEDATPWTWATQSIFSIAVENKSGSVAAIEIPEDIGHVHMRLIGYTNDVDFTVPAKSLYEGSRVVDEAMSWKITGAEASARSAGHLIYKIQPHAIVTLQAVLHPTEQCIGLRIESMWSDSWPSYYAGMLYSFTQGNQLSQLRESDDAHVGQSERLVLDVSEKLSMVAGEPRALAASRRFKNAYGPTAGWPTGVPRLPHGFDDVAVLDTCYMEGSRRLGIAP